MNKKVLFLCLAVVLVAAIARYQRQIITIIESKDDMVNAVLRKATRDYYTKLDIYGKSDKRLTQWIREQGVPREELPFFCNTLVYDNSHKEFVLELNRDIPRLTGMLYESLTGTADAKPDHKCDSRALTLGAILSSLDVEVRLIHVAGYDTAGSLVAHTLLEARTQKDASWIALDPYFGITYRSADDGEPIGIMDVVLQPPHAYFPVSPEGRGWEPNEKRITPELIQSTFCIAVFDNTMNGAPTVVIVNTDRLRKSLGTGSRELLTEQARAFLDSNWLNPVIVFQ